MLHICAPQLSANCLYHLFINPRLVVLENEIMGARAQKSQEDLSKDSKHYLKNPQKSLEEPNSEPYAESTRKAETEYLR